jgi:hypothetical protein
MGLPTTPRRRRLLAGVALTLIVGLPAGACSGDDGHEPSPAATTTTSTVANDPGLVPLLVTPDQLPAGFEPVAEVGDTVPTFCAGEDPTAGLQASGRAVAGYARSPGGVSVLHLVFRFVDGGAATFVDQARDIIGRCSEVPDAHGLAFTYTDPPPALTAALSGSTDDSVATDGVSVGSGSLRSLVGVFRRGDVGAMVAVLAVDSAAVDAEAVAQAAFTAAVGRLPT